MNLAENRSARSHAHGRRHAKHHRLANRRCRLPRSFVVAVDVFSDQFELIGLQSWVQETRMHSTSHRIA